jgi:hypothetical protein
MCPTGNLPWLAAAWIGKFVPVVVPLSSAGGYCSMRYRTRSSGSSPQARAACSGVRPRTSFSRTARGRLSDKDPDHLEGEVLVSSGNVQHELLLLVPGLEGGAATPLLNTGSCRGTFRPLRRGGRSFPCNAKGGTRSRPAACEGAGNGIGTSKAPRRPTGRTGRQGARRGLSWTYWSRFSIMDRIAAGGFPVLDCVTSMVCVFVGLVSSASASNPKPATTRMESCGSARRS